MSKSKNIYSEQSKSQNTNYKVLQLSLNHTSVLLIVV